MHDRGRLVDLLVAASIVLAFGGLFFGRLMLYPVAIAPGTFLERLAAQSTAWRLGHQWMLAGMLCVIPAALGLRRALGRRSPRLCNVAAALAIAGAALGVGQYALDFAMLAAARVSPPAAGAQFVTNLQSDPFVRWTFYKLPDISQAGLILFTVAVWRQGPAWRLPAVLLTAGTLVSLVAPLTLGPLGVRIALGAWFVGFSAVAWKIAHGGAAEAVSTTARTRESIAV